MSVSEWTAIIASVVAVGSLIYSIYSPRLKRKWQKEDQSEGSKVEAIRNLEEAFRKLAEDFVVLGKVVDAKQDNAEAQEARRKLWQEVRSQAKILVDQVLSCRDRFVERRELEKMEKLKEGQLKAWIQSNKMVEESLREVIAQLRKNGQKTRQT